MVHLLLRVFLFFFIFSAYGAVAVAAFIDPLDAPAPQTARPQATALIAVTRTPGKRLVAVGRYGAVLLSDDGGKAWRQAPVPVSTDLVAVYFVTSQLGWAVGHGGVVLKSMDGGLSWIKQLDGRVAATLIKTHFEPLAAAGNEEARHALDDALRFVDEGPGRPFLDVWFQDESNGYVVGAYNLIFRTRDGGKSWVYLGDRVDNPGALHLNAIRNIGGSLFLAGEQGKVWKLDAGQDKFVALKTPYAGTWFGLLGTARTLLAFGLRGNVWRSGDGGLNWTRIDSGLAATVTAGTVLDDGRIVLTTLGGECAVSSDDGGSFTRLPTTQPMPYFGVAAAGGGIALAGARGVRIEPAP